MTPDASIPAETPEPLLVIEEGGDAGEGLQKMTALQRALRDPRLGPMGVNLDETVIFPAFPKPYVGKHRRLDVGQS